jgi:hypothetical protein
MQTQLTTQLTKKRRRKTRRTAEQNWGTTMSNHGIGKPTKASKEETTLTSANKVARQREDFHLQYPA